MNLIMCLLCTPLCSSYVPHMCLLSSPYCVPPVNSSLPPVNSSLPSVNSSVPQRECLVTANMPLGGWAGMELLTTLWTRACFTQHVTHGKRN